MVKPIVKQTESTGSLSQKMKLNFPGFISHLIFWFLACGGLLFDLWSKKAVFSRLKPYEYYDVINGYVRIFAVHNDGAAWSIFSGKSNLLVAVSSIALVVLIVVFLFSGKQPKIIHAAMGLFAAGISGNLYDRYFNNGLVRDFIDVSYRDHHWPTFNVADSLLCIGVGLLIISSFFIETPRQKHDQPQK